MVDDNSILSKVPTEVASKAYDDAISPAARIAGRSLEGVVRTALRPVDGVVWSLDQAFDWVAEHVTTALARRDVSESDVIRPSAELEGRVLHGLQIAGPLSDPILRDLFVELLATSMQPKSSTLAHPAFAEALRQLVPDEARLMCVLGSRPFSIVYFLAKAGCTQKPEPGKVYLGYDQSLIHVKYKWCPLENEAQLEDPDHLGYYLENLGRLGLVQTSRLDDMTSLMFPPYYELRKEVEEGYKSVEENCPETHVPGKSSIVIDVASTTLWGAEFRRACGADHMYCSERGWLTKG
ncbi:MAG: DUF4393 domain-containing protein [Candidatus Marinimicrobia bacterium]|nr:DUF4393 domain-containing protein [Candidatus Neomarinimicrobiota bacterium]